MVPDLGFPTSSVGLKDTQRTADYNSAESFESSQLPHARAVLEFAHVYFLLRV